MKKNILLAFLLCVLYSWQLDAQVSLESDTIYAEINDGVNDVICHNLVSNNLPQVKTYRWVRKEVIMPNGWTSAVCDPNKCFISSVDSMDFDLGPGAFGVLDVHLYPTVDWNGSAMIEVNVKDIGNPNNTITGVYIFDSELTGTNEAQLIQFKVFPNPTSGLFELDGEIEKAAFVKVFNMMGQRLVQMPIQGGDWYNISSLTPGSYLLQLSAEDGSPLGTKLISKL